MSIVTNRRRRRESAHLRERHDTRQRRSTSRKTYEIYSYLYCQLFFKMIKRLSVAISFVLHLEGSINSLLEWAWKRDATFTAPRRKRTLETFVDAGKKSLIRKLRWLKSKIIEQQHGSGLMANLRVVGLKLKTWDTNLSAKDLKLHSKYV